MSNVVQFLETLARSPRPLSKDQFIAAVLQAELEPVAEKALLARDVMALSRILDGRASMFCAIFPADNEEPDNEEQPQEETPAEEQEPKSQAA